MLASETSHSSATALSPATWPWAQRSPAAVSSDGTEWTGALLRCWSGTSPLMEQPPLDHHYIVMHQGGAKRVTRRRDGPPLSLDVDEGSLTLVPAHTAYLWRTEGPIAFTHLYIRPEQLASFMERELDADGRSARLVERIGCRDSELERLLQRMVCEVRAGPAASLLLLDTLLECVLGSIARGHVSSVARRGGPPVALAPHRLRRVLEYIEASLGSDVGLAGLAAAAGSSQSHFVRAFRAATGRSPYGYLLERRIRRAKVLLLTSRDSLAEVSAACGFRRQEQFAAMFKQRVGIGPKRYRLMHCSSH